MKKAAYIPERGDVVWTDFNPQAGREQAGKRPALVLSPKTYNARTGLAVMAPITSHVKGYPFEVAIRIKTVKGVALADHLKNLDWQVRGVKFVGSVAPAALAEVTTKVSLLLNL